MSIAWGILLVGMAYESARRLGFGVVVAGAILLWPPYLEALLGGNVQILLFAAYVALMHHRDGSQLDPADRERPAAVDGLLGAFVAAIKVSQVHAWVWVLRRRPAAAAIGVAAFASAGARSCCRRSGSRRGSTGSRRPAGPATRRGCTSARRCRSSSDSRSRSRCRCCPCWPCSSCRPARASAWVGILSLVGSPSLHMFALLFLLPAMRLVRREIALVAAILVATYVASLIWIAVVVVAWSLLAMDRWPDVLAARRGGERPRQRGVPLRLTTRRVGAPRPAALTAGTSAAAGVTSTEAATASGQPARVGA